MNGRYWARLLGANILAGIFAPSFDALWIDLGSHLIVVLGIYLATLKDTAQ